jgi:IclR family pca regulon transcriptional regulator
MGRVMLAALPAQELDAYFATAKISDITDRTVTDPRKLRAILAQVGKQGYSEVDGELEIGLRALAVPVTDRIGRVVGSIALSTVSSATAGRKTAANPLLAPLRACAHNIHRAIERLPVPARRN